MIATQVSLDTALAGPPAELCVNCEGEAAKNWLLCLDCVAKLDETLLIRLTKKYAQLGEWLAEAEEKLRDMPTGNPQFVAGWHLWSQKLHVYQRLGWLWRTVKAAA
jgi:hypothetical protein